MLGNGDFGVIVLEERADLIWCGVDVGPVTGLNILGKGPFPRLDGVGMSPCERSHADVCHLPDETAVPVCAVRLVSKGIGDERQTGRGIAVHRT